MKHGTSSYLQVAKLSKLLATVVEFAGKRLQMLMNNLVCSNIATLRKSLATNVAVVWSLSGVTTLMSLEVAELREPLAAGWLLAKERLHASVRPRVDLKVRLLIKAFEASSLGALIPLFRLSYWYFLHDSQSLLCYRNGLWKTSLTWGTTGLEGSCLD